MLPTNSAAPCSQEICPSACASSRRMSPARLPLSTKSQRTDWRRFTWRRSMGRSDRREKHSAWIDGKMGISELLQQLRDDKTSGATTLAEQAVEILELFVASQVPPGPRKLDVSLETLVEEILTAQPSMAVMIELARRV